MASLLLFWLLTVPHPRGYVAPFAAQPPKIDGKLDDAAWQAAPWTADFIDIEGEAKPAPVYRTRAKILWDATYLYIGAELEEPNVRGTLTQHDSVIFHDNDFEVFVDPDGDNHNYFEFEINALNTGWDLFLSKPYLAGGKADNSWEIPGLKSAIWVDGTLNNPNDTDRGWTVELAIPWKAFTKTPPPREGDQWRVNFSRVEWFGKPESNWVWSPQYQINMHRPDYWGYVQFAKTPVPFKPDPTWEGRATLARRAEAHLATRKKEPWTETVVSGGRRLTMTQDLRLRTE